jgi:hypothetical protein
MVITEAEKAERFARWQAEREERLERLRAEADERHKRWCQSVRWSRCSAGDRRWFWAVYPSVDDCQARGVDWFPGDPIASGFEPTLEAAEAIARSTAGEGAFIEPRAPARFAGWTLQKRACMKRMNRKPSGKSQTAAIEFVWDVDYYYPEDARPSGWQYTPYRVIKKTAKRVYVEWEHFDEKRWQRQAESSSQANWWDYDVRTFVLDRRQLERDEGLYSRTRRRNFYSTRAAAERVIARHDVTAVRPPWAEILGIDVPCSREAIKRAYRRLVKTAHPDAGGDADAFRRIDDAYRAAIGSS